MCICIAAQSLHICLSTTCRTLYTVSDAVSVHARSSCIRMIGVHMIVYNVSYISLHAQRDASPGTSNQTCSGRPREMYGRTRDNLAASTHNIPATAPRSCSYNYIFKVLFTAPSWYLFAIGFGHMSIF